MRTALHVFAAAFVLTLVCACQPADPLTVAAQSAVDLPPALPTQDPDVSWRRLDTINNCHLYLVRFKDRDFLLATAESSAYGHRAVSDSCALVPAS